MFVFIATVYEFTALRAAAKSLASMRNIHLHQGHKNNGFVLEKQLELASPPPAVMVNNNFPGDVEHSEAAGHKRKMNGEMVARPEKEKIGKCYSIFIVVYSKDNFNSAQVILCKSLY